ncbi:GTP-binding protein Di-Ras2 [Aphidius gifuensis]|uniref:GTP-binding protein Di-Ras2 n=1 Tax=Aphidius gifuensis TaxID=684658 RepID=UPI001CDC134B|nr:GTP-binding protein Di-Ras2 [Aphidius gifuensis]
MPEQSNDYRVVVFGAGGVGKSSLVLRFVKGTFRESYIPTIEDTYRQVGNKCDESPSIREVTMSEGASEAANWGCGFLETSAKTNHNVNELFRDLLTLEKNRSVSLQPVQSNSAISLKEKCTMM